MSAVSEKTEGVVNRIIDLKMQNFLDRFVDVSNTQGYCRK